MKEMRIALWSFALSLMLTASAYARDLPDFTELVEKQGAAVVNISSSQAAKDDNGDGRMPGMPQNHPLVPRGRETTSLGSGFIISTDGYILTNAHVVEDADEVTVRLTDKQEFKAKVIGSDTRTDVALLKINATGLPKVLPGDPGRLKVGEWVAAIGSPFGFENSVTAGIVSAKGRSLPQENYVPFIQTDVAINPGNSGGPLFNLKGEVVGINSQIFSRTGGFMGLSFAIPIDVAMDISNQLRATGRVSRGWLGVVIQEVSSELAETFALSKPTGALIASVQQGGPADKAGLQPSDVVLKFDGKAVQSSSELPRLVGPTRPGSKVAVEVWRRGAAKEINVVVGEMPADKVAQAPAKDDGRIGKLGLALSELNPAQKHQLGIAGGVLVEDVNGAAARAGIRRGDVILAFNNHSIASAEQLGELLAKAGGGRNVALLVRRGARALYIPLRISAN
jgi:serine protease Do